MADPKTQPATDDGDNLTDEQEDALYPDPNDPEMEEEENEDGSVTVRFKAEDVIESGFYDNLAGKIDVDERRKIAMKYLELIEYDRRARAKRDKQYKKGLERTGIANPAPGGADFEGASDVSSPLLTECSIDIAASLYKEVFPADGPCKMKEYGNGTRSNDTERAERIRDFMNWQLTTQIEEYEETLDETLSQVPLAGSQYMRFWYDSEWERPRVEYVPQDDIFLPYACGSFRNARRMTHRERLTLSEIAERIASGFYIDQPFASLPGGWVLQEEDQVQMANDKIEGKEDANLSDGEDDESTREAFNVYTFLQLFDDERPMPYIITIDRDGQDMYRVVRNWEKGDEKCLAMSWIVEFPFIRWRGAYSLGFAHIIGGLTAAATGALRSLLDSAHINNMPSAIKLKGNGTGGQSLQIDPTGIAEVEGMPGVDDIRKVMMPIPFNPPSPILFQLLGWITDAAKGVATTSEEKVADASNTGPVGTTLALIEQGSKVFSAIHKRTHRAQKDCLAILYRINRMYLTKELVIEELGNLKVQPDDFDAPSPVQPVSDPNIFCEAQRITQMQMIHQLNDNAVAAGQVVFDQRALYKRTLQTARIPNYEELLVKQPEPKDLNPVAENMQMALGTPSVAFPMQDHFAHIQTHLSFLQDPNLGGNPLIAPTFSKMVAEHIKQHLVLAYAKMMYDKAQQFTETPIEELMGERDSDTRAEFDRYMATVAAQMQPDTDAAFSKVTPILAQLAQQLQSMQPPPPMDPAQVAMADVQRKQQADQAENQNKVVALNNKREEARIKAQEKQQSLAAQAEQNRQKNVSEAMAHEQEARDRQARIAADLTMNQDDNQTALEIADKREQTRSSGMITGSETTNPTP